MASGQLLDGGAGINGFREKQRCAETKFNAHKSHTKSASRNGNKLLTLAPADDLSSSYQNSSPRHRRSLPVPLPASSVASGDGASLNRLHQTLIGRNHQSVSFNGPHHSVTISLASRSKEEVRNLRHKLAAELELVRAMALKLETRELQASSLPPVAGYTTSQLSASDPNTQLPAKRKAASSERGGSSLVEEGENEKPTSSKANQYYRNSDFCLGMEKLWPAESNGRKNHKVNRSKEIILVEADRTAYENEYRSCRDLLEKVMKHKHGWVFNSPVDVKKLNIPDYFRIIKHPMDLGTIWNRLYNHFYKSPGEFADDVRLTFNNAMTYNPKGQDVYHMAEQLLNMFEESWKSIVAQYPHPSYPSSMMKTGNLDLRILERCDSIVHSTPIETRIIGVDNVSHIERPLPLKKPKAKDPYKRDMTFEEKQRLSNNLQNLPHEKLENIVQIFKKRNSSLSQNDDEIEVDIDSVDVETLWELDRFVINYKKSLSKNKRIEKLAILASAGIYSDGNGKVQVTGHVAAGNLKEAEIVMDEKVLSSPPLRNENKRENSGSSTHSRSSSSDSGSSFLDSDSESSSGGVSVEG